MSVSTASRGRSPAASTCGSSNRREMMKRNFMGVMPAMNQGLSCWLRTNRDNSNGSRSMAQKASRLFVLAAILIALTVRAAEKPNIVYVLCDDLGYGDLKCLNAGGKIA